jgi:hypothetical protein
MELPKQGREFTSLVFAPPGRYISRPVVGAGCDLYTIISLIAFAIEYLRLRSAMRLLLILIDATCSLIPSRPL